ncbi:MAG TPA: GxxExxY protein [Pontiella sp.]|nr:GxxExxY protein [Pontiella sp.]
MGDIIFKEECFQINGACFEVYKNKGCGFLEDVYQECLEIEMELRGMDFVSQAPLELDYKGKTLRKKYIPDLICFGAIIVEIKAVKQISDEHRAQVQNYLKATGYKLGLLVNFGHYPKVQIERIAN